MPKRSTIYAKRVLPNRPFPKATLRVVVEAIVETWRLIREKPRNGFSLSAATEDVITWELRTRLMDEVLDSPKLLAFTSNIFRVYREPKSESFDRKHLDKMPDLLVAVIRNCSPGLLSADGLFVECKPVGKPTPTGQDYCDAGVKRFVVGEYAWAMPHALMIGYAATGYMIPKKLTEAITSRKAELKTDGSVTKCKGPGLGPHAQVLHETIHQRGFTYLQTRTKAPEIQLLHLWLNRD